MYLRRERRPLRAHRAGTTPSTLIAAPPEGAGRPQPRRLLHHRPGEQRGGLPLPALRPARSAPTTCPTARTCATSRAAPALTETIGVGKGTVDLDDFTDHADSIVVVGQNPGTNHPRMLTALEQAKRRGARIVAVNPLPEAGPQPVQEPAERARACSGEGTEARRPLPAGARERGPRVVRGGQQGPARARGERSPGSRPRPRVHRDLLRRLRRGVSRTGAASRLGRDSSASSGIAPRTRSRTFAADVRRERRASSSAGPWASPSTRNAVATIREIVNFLLLRGNIGRPGAGPSPVRGHSNVQGDRTMGIWEKMPDRWFLDRLQRRVRLRAARARHGYDTVDTIRAMRDGRVDVFFALGGNFVAATPDTDGRRSRDGQLRAHRARRHQAQPLAPLPRTRGAASALPRPHRARPPSERREQFVTVEDSMSMVHQPRADRSSRVPTHLRSEVAIVAGLAQALFGDDLGWDEMGRDYSAIRRHIENVVAGLRGLRAARPRRRAGSRCRAGRTTRGPSTPRPARPASR